MNNIIHFVNKWNYKYPVDYWWRKKHKVAFNSSRHRDCNFWDQLFEYYEDCIFKSLIKENEYEPNQNDYLKIDENKFESITDNISDALLELKKFKDSHGN